jgi:hypothetical protein
MSSRILGESGPAGPFARAGDPWGPSAGPNLEFDMPGKCVEKLPQVQKNGA